MQLRPFACPVPASGITPKGEQLLRCFHPQIQDWLTLEVLVSWTMLPDNNEGKLELKKMKSQKFMHAG
jgi:hypothetical protein